MEKIVTFISLPNMQCVREVLVDIANDADEQEAKLKALSTSSAWLCAEYFAGSIQLEVRDAPPPRA